MKMLMGIDLGTSGLKTIIISMEGEILAVSKRGYGYDSPQAGWAEQDPEAWWRVCLETMEEALGSRDPTEVAGIGFSGQRHGLVMIDDHDKPIRPAILHCDTRSEKQVRQLREMFTREETVSLMRNSIYTGFLLPSLLWVKENEPRNYVRIRQVMLPKDYLKFRMSGEISTDNSDASGTLAFDIDRHCWSEEILKRVNIPIEFFPRTYESATPIGCISSLVASRIGLLRSTTIVAGGGDQVMQGLGNGMLDVGDVTVHIGSSGQVSFQTDKPLADQDLRTNMFCGYKRGRWIAVGATMSAGLSLKWWHSLLEETDFSRTDHEIETISPGAGGLLFLPYLNGERTPHLDPMLRGTLLGLSPSTTKSRISRAIMEGVVYSLRQALDTCTRIGYMPKSIVASGGGAASRPWLQIQADIFNLPIRTVEFPEQAGLGAAIVAGVGCGIFADFEDGCEKSVRPSPEVIFPDERRSHIYDNYYEIFKFAQHSTAAISHKLAWMATEK